MSKYKQALSLTVSILLTLVILFPQDAMAQCAMCKASAETSMDSGSKNIAGINQGIIYLLVAPYLLVAIVGYIWWRSRRKGQAEEAKNS